METTQQARAHTAHNIPAKYAEHLPTLSETDLGELQECRFRLVRGCVKVVGDSCFAGIDGDTLFYRGTEIRRDSSNRGYYGHYRIGGWRSGSAHERLSEAKEWIDRRIEGVAP